MEAFRVKHLAPFAASYVIRPWEWDSLTLAEASHLAANLPVEG